LNQASSSSSTSTLLTFNQQQNTKSVKMLFTAILPVALLFTSALAGPVKRDDDEQKRICPNLKVADRGCIRYTRGFDVTGVVTEVDLTFPLVRNECDCIQECLNRPTTCANYVWKFSTPASIQSGHRTCTLYSQFNLPTDVTIEVNVGMSKNVALLQPGNNPQAGGAVPQAFKDINGTIPDNEAVSGPVWQLADGRVLC
jgi:hypothetical protein